MNTIVENDRHRISRGSGRGIIDSALNSLTGVQDPVRISIYDKKTRQTGIGIARSEQDAQNRAWTDLNSKNNR